MVAFCYTWKKPLVPRKKILFLKCPEVFAYLRVLSIVLDLEKWKKFFILENLCSTGLWQGQQGTESKKKDTNWALFWTESEVYVKQKIPQIAQLKTFPTTPYLAETIEALEIGNFLKFPKEAFFGPCTNST